MLLSDDPNYCSNIVSQRSLLTTPVWVWRVRYIVTTAHCCSFIFCEPGRFHTTYRIDNSWGVARKCPSRRNLGFIVPLNVPSCIIQSVATIILLLKCHSSQSVFSFAAEMFMSDKFILL